MRTTVIRRLLLPALLAIHAGLLAYGAAVHSPSIDEVGHLAAGLSHWQFGKFDLYHVNPPLVRMVAAVPVLFAQPKTDWSQYSDAPGAVGVRDRPRPHHGQRRALVLVLHLGAVGVHPVQPAGRIRLLPLGAGAVRRLVRPARADAVVLRAEHPGQRPDDYTGHGGDGLRRDGGLRFLEMVETARLDAALAAGVALGLALLTKTTWIILFALWPVLWLVWRLPERRLLSGRAWLGQGLQLATIFVLGVYLLNAGYGFEGSFGRLGDYRFVSEQSGRRGGAGRAGGRAKPLRRDVAGRAPSRSRGTMYWASTYRSTTSSRTSIPTCAANGGRRDGGTTTCTR